MDLPASRIAARGELLQDQGLVADLDGDRANATVIKRGREFTVFAYGSAHRFEIRTTEPVQDEAPGGTLTAPMSGNIIQVLVSAGERIEKGRALLVLEAMKMEHTISAPASGVVQGIFYAVGDQVKEGAQLLAIETTE
jgi:3-methylcrotonyl-CoA carboxylase alpha subunit